MPLEGHAERVNTPLRPRDRHVLVVLALVTLVAVVAASVYAIARPSSSGVHCISFTVPASMGGAAVRECDAGATHYCRVNAIVPQAVEACNRAGFAVGAKP
jgi:hypothetical protein